MTIKTPAHKGVPKREIAGQLDLSEGTVRYHLKRMAAQTVDGRSRQQRKASTHAVAIEHWMSCREATGLNIANLHQWLIDEHGYTGSLRSVQRYVHEHFPAPRQRARRRVETPPGVQAQVDWAVYPRQQVAGEVFTLNAFHITLSFSRHSAVIWSMRQDLLSWLWCHNRALEQLGGVPAVLRVDNTRTAVSSGSGPSGIIHPAYQRYATMPRFHVDACLLPYSPEHKGKVERHVRTQRQALDIQGRSWSSLSELQSWSNECLQASESRRRCPATGTSVAEAFEQERPHLGSLPQPLPEPFDHVAQRRVSRDCLVSFEGRQYSVPFAWLGQQVEVRGLHQRIQIIKNTRVIAEHPRHTAKRLVIERSHYEGTSTDTIQAPTPLGRMASHIQAIADMPVDQRPIDLYGALAEVAR